jgi:23S rRNA pseudouridine1911/1915/1917 synthase
MHPVSTREATTRAKWDLRMYIVVFDCKVILNYTSVDVLYQDNHLLVVVKPAGMLVQGDRTGDDDLLSEAKQYLKIEFNKPGNVFVGLVHRLDRPVSGVVVFARTSKAASRLSEQFRSRIVEKSYLALVEGWLAEPLDLRHFLKKTRRRTEVVKQGTRRAKEAVLSCRPLKIIGRETLIEVDLDTGRAHQIRAQLAAEGHPVVGDTRYGAAPGPIRGAIALHCARMGIRHPVKKVRMVWSAPLPESWPSDVRSAASSLPNYLV